MHAPNILGHYFSKQENTMTGGAVAKRKCKKWRKNLLVSKKNVYLCLQDYETIIITTDDHAETLGIILCVAPLSVYARGRTDWPLYPLKSVLEQPA